MARAAATALVMVTCANQKQGSAIAHALVAERLAACVNLVAPIRSIYRWRGKIEDDQEVLLLIKTRSALARRVERKVRLLHTYEIPEVMVVRFYDGSSPYLSWLLESTAAPRARKAAKK